eukprot:1783318-Prymnesium_polylepis.1
MSSDTTGDADDLGHDEWQKRGHHAWPLEPTRCPRRPEHKQLRGPRAAQRARGPAIYRARRDARRPLQGQSPDGGWSRR